ncbi:MAG: type IV secretory system conjugative DNA transfer family protein, partial [Solirubrobacterales bacterium]
LRPSATEVGDPPAVVRLKKHSEFIKRVKVADHFEHEREPAMNRLMTAMSATGGAAFVQIALTPAPASFERHAKHLYKRHEARLARERRAGDRVIGDRSLVEESELRGGLEVQHRPLFFTDIRIAGDEREVCERIASELRASGAENHLVERGTGLRHGAMGLYRRRVRRGEGNPWPSWRKGVFASTELAALWHLPSVGYLTVPFARAPVALAPAPPSILRPGEGAGTLTDALGPVTLHQRMRQQNTAVPGTVEQGKTSYLVATVAEDLRRENCAVIVLDPKGDAAEAAVSLVAPERTCTLLDLAHPTCGFNPLAVQAPADTIADYVVGALKHLFTDSDIRASSDRYLRNAIIAVLAYDRNATLWDAARLLSVGEEGYAYRARVGARVRELPEFKEISEFFTAELAAQLADARSMTTAKLDAPVNKLARLLNSPSIKRVLLNDSLRVDFDRLIAAREVLVVRGALGAMGAGNTSVLMQLLVGMLDAALARQQDLVAAARRVSVALKVDEAPLVLNRGFAETLALKRSAGLETVACWQSEAQWTEREVREQLDALFAHRVYFATASVADARASASLMMAEFSDVVRPGESLSALGNPDARLRLPKHHAIVSWSTPEGRQPPFIARTIPLRVDRERLALHAARQAERGGRHLADLTQPHWDRREVQRARAGTEGQRGTEGRGEEEGRAAHGE